MSWTLGEIAEIVGGELHGPSELPIRKPVPAGDSSADGITFAESEKYLQMVEASGVGAVFVKPGGPPPNKPYILVQSPREAFGRVLAMAFRDLPVEEGIHPTAIVDVTAVVEKGARIGAYSVIEAGTRVCDGARVYPFCYVGPDCYLASGAKLYPHAVLYGGVRLGERSIIHSGAVLGADGFGYFWDGQRHRKVPQVGVVNIGDDCEIGALTAVDRATAGSTSIGKGTKIDNLVQIAHNVQLGTSNVIAAQSGIAGSSTLGDRNMLGGQVGISDHVSIGNDNIFATRTGVTSDIEQPDTYWGCTFVRRATEETRLQLLFGRLPELMKRIKALESEVARLKNESS